MLNSKNEHRYFVYKKEGVCRVGLLKLFTWYNLISPPNILIEY